MRRFRKLIRNYVCDDMVERTMASATRSSDYQVCNTDPGTPAINPFLFDIVSYA